MIQSIEILERNVTNDSDVLSIHNPIIFLIEVTYTEETPETVPAIIFGLNIESGVYEELGTFACMPYKDVDNTHRQFIFVANNIIKSYMSSFDDTFINENVIQYVEGMTRDFAIIFQELNMGVVAFTALHATRQYGENQNLIDVYRNETNNTYYAALGMPVYVYYYNYDENNSVDDNSELEYWADTDGILFEEGNALMISL